MSAAAVAEPVAPLGSAVRTIVGDGVRLYLLAALLAVAVAWWASAPYAVGVYHDDGVYVILAKALATGHGFHYLHLPGEPAATHYPPLYPLLLAALWRIAPGFPGNVSVFLFANAVLLGLASVGIALFAERVMGWPRVAAIAVALAATLSTPLLMLSGLVLSEPLFVAGLWPLLAAAERAVGDEESRAADIVALGLGLGALTLARIHAVLLFGAVMALLALRRRWQRALLCGAAFVAALAPWQVWLSLHSAPLPDVLRGAYGPYLHWLTEGLHGHAFGFLAATIRINVREVAALLADRFALSDAATPRLIASIFATAACAAGAVGLWRRAPTFVLFALFYTLVLLAFPSTPWRYLYAVWPVVVLCVGAGIEWSFKAITARAPESIVGALGGVALCSLVIGAARSEFRAYRTRTWAQPTAAATAQIAPIVRWARAETRANDVIAADGEQLVYLFAGRRAVPLAPSTSAEYVYPRRPEDNARSLRRELAELPVDYVLTISPVLRQATDLVVAPNSTPHQPSLLPLAPLGAGEAYRVER